MGRLRNPRRANKQARSNSLEIKPISQSSPKRRVRYRKEGLGQLIRPIVYAMQPRVAASFSCFHPPSPIYHSGGATDLADEIDTRSSEKLKPLAALSDQNNAASGFKQEQPKLPPCRCDAAARKRASDKSHYVSYSHFHLRIIPTSTEGIRDFS
jgi:hypothetical protein